MQALEDAARTAPAAPRADEREPESSSIQAERDRLGDDASRPSAGDDRDAESPLSANDALDSDNDTPATRDEPQDAAASAGADGEHDAQNARDVQDGNDATAAGRDEPDDGAAHDAPVRAQNAAQQSAQERAPGAEARRGPEAVFVTAEPTLANGAAVARAAVLGATALASGNTNEPHGANTPHALAPSSDDVRRAAGDVPPSDTSARPAASPAAPALVAIERPAFEARPAPAAVTNRAVRDEIAAVRTTPLPAPSAERAAPEPSRAPSSSSAIVAPGATSETASPAPALSSSAPSSAPAVPVEYVAAASVRVPDDAARSRESAPRSGAQRTRADAQPLPSAIPLPIPDDTTAPASPRQQNEPIFDAARLRLEPEAEPRTTRPAIPAAARAEEVEMAVRLDQARAELAPGSVGGPQISATSMRVLSGISAGAGTAAFEPQGTDADDPAHAGRLVRGLSAMVHQRGGVMTMRLEPPDLGAVRVQMAINQGTVVAQFTATTEHAQAIIDRSLSVLRTALEQHGLTVERLVVHLSPAAEPAAQTARQESGDAQQNGQHSRHDAAEEESRGRHDHDQDGDERGNPRERNGAAFLERLGALADFGGRPTATTVGGHRT